MNRWMIGSKGLGEIPDLHTDMAFNKGVEWFAEIFCFYGVLFSIVGYEMWKAQVSGTLQRNLLTTLSKQKADEID